MTSTPDDFASATRELALAALQEVTPASTIGPAAGHTVEDSGAVSLRFENRLPGYPGWYWTVSIAQVDDAEPTVLEVELMPGDGALLAPDWVPWAERLAEYRAHQSELAAQGAKTDAEADGSGDETDDDGEDLDDVDDLDAADFDEDGSPHLHGGDLDGVDIDELDEDSDDADADDADAEDADADDADDEDADDGPSGSDDAS